VGLTFRSIRIAFDTDHRKNNDGCRFTIGVDMPAAAHIAGFVWKADYFAHCMPLLPFRPMAALEDLPDRRLRRD
jgi:hypothetical protein